MRKSVWSQTVDLPKFKTLEGDVKTDVLIIGGGMAGLLTAYYLKQKGIDYVLVEGAQIASGIPKNPTAKITSQHGLIYDKLINELGREKAQMYFSANQKAVKEFFKLSETIDCDFEKKQAFTYTLSDREKIENEIKAVNSLGFPAEFKKTTELPFETKGAVCFPEQAQFNPLKFLKEITKDLNIYENTFITDITPSTAISDKAKITAKKIIITTHFPFINKHGSYFLKLYQHRSYVSAFDTVHSVKEMYVDEALDGLSFRTHDGLLLVGGGSHRTGKSGGAWKELNSFARKYYPDAKLKYEWATQDCMSLDSIPYIGQYSKSTPNMYVATGFNKWGMTSSMVAAKILCDLVREKKNEFAAVFSPSRSILKPQLFINGLESTKNLLTPTTKRCPHLGCALKWNKYEHSWDCPCHGSRFDENGKLIDNPATGNIKGM